MEKTWSSCYCSSFSTRFSTFSYQQSALFAARWLQLPIGEARATQNPFESNNSNSVNRLEPRVRLQQRLGATAYSKNRRQTVVPPSITNKNTTQTAFDFRFYSSFRNGRPEIGVRPSRKVLFQECPNRVCGDCLIESDVTSN